MGWLSVAMKLLPRHPLALRAASDHAQVAVKHSLLSAHNDMAAVENEIAMMRVGPAMATAGTVFLAGKRGATRGKHCVGEYGLHALSASSQVPFVLPSPPALLAHGARICVFVFFVCSAAPPCVRCAAERAPEHRDPLRCLPLPIDHCRRV